MPNYTPNFGLPQPLVNNATDQDLWGNELNTGIGDVDGLILTALNFITNAQTASFSVVAPTAQSTTTGSSKTLFLCNATSGAIIPSLPSAASTGNGFTVAFKKTDNTANAVIPTANGSDTIDGGTTFSITTQYAWVILVADGVSNWNVISDFASTAGLPTLAGNNTYTGTNVFSSTTQVPTVSSGDSTTNAASTAFVNPGSSLGSSGYQKLPNGLIMQWGSYPSGGPTSNSFPIAFPNACFVVVATPNGAGDSAAVTTSNITKTSFTTYVGYNIVGGLWLAVGN